MQASMLSQLVADALMTAVWRRGRPAKLLHHSDQGSQYSSEHFQKLLIAGHHLQHEPRRRSLGQLGHGSFFSSMKTERTACKVYRLRQQARSDVFDYIERFYNPTRRHSTLGYGVSPIMFEEAQEASVGLQNRQQLTEIAQKHEVHPNQVTQWRRQLLERAADVLGGATFAEAPAVDLKALHAKIGQVALENDFLEGALGKAGAAERKAMIDRTHGLPIKRQASAMWRELEWRSRPEAVAGC